MKKNILLGILVVLVLVAMCLPWAVYRSWSEPGKTHYFIGEPFFFLGAFASGGIHFTASLFFALLASGFAFFSSKHRACSLICCILLLLSATYLIMADAPSFDHFTVLTWVILAALIGVALFAFFGFRKKSAA